MALDPRTLDLSPLFRDPRMFASRAAWRAAGFDVPDRSDPNKVMVGRHAAVKGYLFKRYHPGSSKDAHTENYQRRIAGAQKVTELIAKHSLRGVIAPEKWLYELPREFGRAEHVLIVEELPLKTDDGTKRAYADISEDTLHALCVVLHAFPGLDSIAKNLPFTKDGQVAFIDTEHWERHRDRKLKLHIGSHLSSSRRKLAQKILEKLDDGDARHDFSDEEDTSSNSSSSSSSS